MRRAIRLLHPDNLKGDITEEEKALVVRLHAKHGPAWKKIGRIMGRFPAHLSNLWSRLGDGAAASGLWSASEESRLVELITRHGERSSGTGGYVNIPWTLVARELGTRSPGQVLAKWASGFGERRLGLAWTAADDLALARGVAADGGETRDEVYWHEVMPGRYVTDCRRRFDQLAKRLTHSDQLSFIEVVDRLVVDLEAAAMSEKAAAEGKFADRYRARRAIGGGGSTGDSKAGPVSKRKIDGGGPGGVLPPSDARGADGAETGGQLRAGTPSSLSDAGSESAQSSSDSDSSSSTDASDSDDTSSSSGSSSSSSGSSST